MDLQMQARRILEQDLRKALPAGEFELYYQPVVNLASNEVSGFEALIRWNHPEQGVVAPGAFIPLAEDIGLIVPIGEWVIRQACATAARWPEDLHVAVNISAIQFRNPGLLQVIVGALAASGLPATRLEIEITETVLLQDKETTLAILHQLRALGVGIAMDDFGTGYSSLTYLQCFPFDKIKIDRSFVKDITENTGSLNIVRAVAALASGMGRRPLPKAWKPGNSSTRLPPKAVPRCKDSCSVSRFRYTKSSGCSFQGARRQRLQPALSRPDRPLVLDGTRTPARSWPASQAARRDWRAPATR
jgi:EAL domain-containing protein (putative c-di-GMP-specific phosphodiesterase class I)